MQRKKTKKCKNMRRCSCGCNRLCNGHDIIRVGCAVNYVKKLGWKLNYLAWKKPLKHWELKNKLKEIENE